MGSFKASVIERIFKKYVARANAAEAILLIDGSKDDQIYQTSQGNFSKDDHFLAASLTKLFISALILKLVDENRLRLEEPLGGYFDRELLEGLHVFEGQDLSAELRVADLLCQTSGLADCYVEGETPLVEQLLAGDFSISIQERIRLTKALGAHFRPAAPGKAFYADINFNLLGLLAESVTEKALAQLLQEKICQPLGLKETYLLEEKSVGVPGVYLEDCLIERPHYLATDASSGLVTTASDLMIFLKAFYQHQLFEEDVLDGFNVSNQLQATWAPIRYGAGFMQLPLRLSGEERGKKAQLLGHTGSTGAFAFYYPHKELYLVGSLQQMARPELVVGLLLELAMKL